jgi:GNAT superfamily N-acetyltransferase
VLLAAPEPLAETHELADFTSGAASLDDWLKRRARGNQASGATRTFVVAEERRVVAYYAIASGGISVGNALGRFRRNMPDPIPIAFPGRLAVDRGWQGRGLGGRCFAIAPDGCCMRLAASGFGGSSCMQISEQAKAFYLALGFETSPLDPMTLMVTLGDVQAAFGGHRRTATRCGVPSSLSGGTAGWIGPAPNARPASDAHNQFRIHRKPRVSSIKAPPARSSAASREADRTDRGNDAATHGPSTPRPSARAVRRTRWPEPPRQPFRAPHGNPLGPAPL